MVVNHFFVTHKIILKIYKKKQTNSSIYIYILTVKMIWNSSKITFYHTYQWYLKFLILLIVFKFILNLLKNVGW